MEEIARQEYDYVVNLFLKDSPYTRKTEDKRKL